MGGEQFPPGPRGARPIAARPGVGCGVAGDVLGPFCCLYPWALCCPPIFWAQVPRGTSPLPPPLDATLRPSPCLDWRRHLWALSSVLFPRS